MATGLTNPASPKSRTSGVLRLVSCGNTVQMDTASSLILLLLLYLLIRPLAYRLGKLPLASWLTHGGTDFADGQLLCKYSTTVLSSKVSILDV
ncbi:unnamed protein product [Gordionus sp. m RMFG-2023]